MQVISEWGLKNHIFFRITIKKCVIFKNLGLGVVEIAILDKLALNSKGLRVNIIQNKKTHMYYRSIQDLQCSVPENIESGQF